MLGSSRGSGAVLLTASLVAALTSMSGRGVAAPAGGWSQEPAAAPDAAGYLFGVTSTSSTAWAVGQTTHNDHGRSLIERRKSGSWVQVKAPDPVGADELLGVSATSSSNAWAVGDRMTADGQAVTIFHWNGSKWAQQKAPGEKMRSHDPSAPYSRVLMGVAALSAHNVWATGGEGCEGFGCHERAYVEHYNGARWRHVTTPNVSPLFTLNAVSGYDAHHVWAVGEDQNHRRSLIERWNGTAWKTMTVHQVGTDDGLFGVVALSAKNVWAVGSAHGSHGDAPLTLHLVHGNWVHVASPRVGNHGSGFESVSGTTGHDLWAVGEYNDGSENDHPLIEHFDGKTWTRVTLPDFGPATLTGVSARSATSAFAVGSNVPDSHPDNRAPLVLGYH